MKKQIFFLLFLAMGTMALKLPDPKVFSSSSLVWCGIDLSNAKCVGVEGFNDPYAIKYKIFPGWNELVLAESNKYNIREFYQKGKVVDDLSVVNRRNELPAHEDLVVTEPYTFAEGQLEKIIEDYKFTDQSEGVGVVYVVESLNKVLEKASVYVVFFDLATNDILWQQKYMETPRGFGFRNYWAGAFYKVMKASEKDYSKAMKGAKKG